MGKEIQRSSYENWASAYYLSYICQDAVLGVPINPTFSTRYSALQEWFSSYLL